MIVPALEIERARRLLHARLGREPQDMLEAAVVLEAWAGVPAQRALATARELMPVVPAEASASVSKQQPSRPRSGVVLEGAAFVLTVVAIALWATPLTADLGARVVEHALKLALPVTLALQWGLRSRYLGRPKGLLEFARHRRAIAAAACAIVVLPTLALGESGALAGLLTLTWMGGTVLIRRRWYAVYGLIVVCATPAMIALPAVPVLAATTALTVAAVAVAIRPGAAGEPASPGRWTRAGASTAIGAGLGLLLVSDPSVTWTAGTVPALALLPSTIAGLWAGHRLWRLEHLIPRAVTGVAVGAQVPRLRRNGPLGGLLGSIARLVWLTAALSAALLLTPWLHSAPSRVGLLAGFGLLALATLLASLLEGLGRAHWAVAGVLVGVAVELLARLETPPAFPGAPLTAGATVAVLVLLGPALALLARPARTLATAMWIT